MQKNRFPALVTSIIVGLLVVMTSACPQGGRLEVRARPHQAYVFLDGVPMGDVSRTDGYRVLIVGITPGEHTVEVRNYGYKPEIQKVTIADKKTTRLEVVLTPLGGPVSGPFGRIQIEGVRHSAVLLNGKTPDYFVGDSDEFNNDIGWKQELLVPPGTHQLTLMQGQTTVWSGSVTVAANQRVIIFANKGGQQVTRTWPRGEKLSNLPRFRAGMASATVAVAPVTAKLAADQTQINCGGSSRLSWSSDGSVHNEISGLGEVAASGEQAVQPKQTTSYKLTASGPGGIVTSDATVNVTSAVQASLRVSPAEVRYRRVGDKVVEQGSATVTWSASGADSVNVDPFGSVAASGERAIQATPSKTTAGPVDETVTYTLTGTNGCGGSATQTATLHITGSNELVQAAVSEQELEVRLALNSIYFPYNLPTKADPTGGLVPSQESRLRALVDNFKQYLHYRPEAHLMLQAHADRRGTSAYNMELTERRAQRVKRYLVEAGISEAQLETKAFGKEHNLTAAEVQKLNEQNPNLTPEDRQRVARQMVAFLMANNRRVDIVLTTTGQQSLRYYPYNSDDLRVLLGEPGKAKPKAKKAQEKK